MFGKADYMKIVVYMIGIVQNYHLFKDNNRE